MLSLIDNPESQPLATPSRHWRDHSLCLNAGVDMDPDPSEKTKNLIAKSLCSGCPVAAQCLRESERADNYGVWGGLTRDERMRLKVRRRDGSGPWIVRCAQCDLACVPPVRDLAKCDSCITEGERPVGAEPYREKITVLIEAGHTYKSIAELIGLRREIVCKACIKWGIRSPQGRRVVKGGFEQNDLAPCGTPAAKLRHRRAGQDVKQLTCACSQPGSSNPRKTRANGWKAA